MTIWGGLTLVMAALVMASVGRVLVGRWITGPSVLSASLLLPVVIYAVPIRPLTTLTLVVAALTFTVGYVVVHGGAQAGLESVVPKLPWHVERRYRSAAIGLFCAAQLALLLNLLRVIQVYGPFAYFLRTPKEIEMVFGQYTVVNYVFFLNMYVAALAVILLALGRGSRWWLRIVLVLAVLTLILNGIKSSMVLAAIIAFFTGITVQSVRGPRLFAGFLVVMAVGLGAFALLNANALGGGSVNAVAERSATAIGRYIAPNYGNLDLELYGRSYHTFGKYTFKFVTKLLNSDIKGYYGSDFLLSNPDDNMGTFLREYFVDFGPLGVTVVPFLLGGLTAGIYVTWRRRLRPAWAVISAISLAACSFAFFGNSFVRLQFLFLAVVALGVDGFAWGSADEDPPPVHLRGC